MLNLDQVRLLENRVEKAVGKIQSLTTENAHLRSQLSGLQARVGELEGLVRSFKDDQGRIEEGILNALDRLSAFEDSVFNAEPKPQAASPVQQSQPEIVAEHEEDLLASIEDSILTEAVSVPVSDSAATGANQESEKNAQAPAASDGQMDIF
jgi:hypothetical protein